MDVLFSSAVAFAVVDEVRPTGPLCCVVLFSLERRNHLVYALSTAHWTLFSRASRCECRCRTCRRDGHARTEYCWSGTFWRLRRDFLSERRYELYGYGW